MTSRHDTVRFHFTMVVVSRRLVFFVLDVDNPLTSTCRSSESHDFFTINLFLKTQHKSSVAVKNFWQIIKKQFEIGFLVKSSFY